MNRMRNPAGLALLGALLVFGIGCNRDPGAKRNQYLAEGEKDLAAGKLEDAAIRFSNAAKADPKSAKAHFELGRVQVQLTRFGEAVRSFERVLQLEPSHVGAKVALGELMLGAKDIGQAEKYAQGALDSNAGDPDAHRLMATVRWAQDRRPEAVALIEQALTLHPSNATLWTTLAGMQFAERKADLAEVSLKKAQAADPSSVEATRRLGYLFQSQKRWAEAEEQFRKAIALKPAIGPRVDLARMFTEKGDKSAAEAVMKEGKQSLAGDPVGFRMLADYYLSIGDSNAAQAEFAELLKTHGSDTRLKRDYAKVLLLKGQDADAQRLIDEILKSNKKDSEALMLRGQILNRKGDAEGAIHALEAAVDSDPENARAQFELGSAFNTRGSMARAETAWRETVRLDPNHLAAHLGLAQIAMQKRDKDLMKQCEDAILRLAPRAAEGHIVGGLLRAANKDVAGAEASLKRATEVAPQNPLGFLHYGLFRFSTANFAEAEKLCRRALELQPASMDAVQCLVASHLARKDLPGAVAAVDLGLQRAPSSARLQIMKAELLMGSRNYAGASKALEAALSAAPNNPDALLMLAKLELSKGDLESAVARANAAVAKHPNDARSYFLLGTFEQSRGNWQVARSSYERALQLQPEFAPAANNLAFLLLEKGQDPALALTLAQKAHDLSPDSPSVSDTLAWAYYHNGATSQAIALLEDALKKRPNSATYHYHLGMSYLKSGDKRRAKEHLARMLELEPGHPSAKDARSMIQQL